MHELSITPITSLIGGLVLYDLKWIIKYYGDDIVVRSSILIIVDTREDGYIYIYIYIYK